MNPSVSAPPPHFPPHFPEAPPALVDVDWLAGRLDDPQVRIVDATFFLPTQQRDAAEEHTECRLPGAVFFDIDAIADPHTNLPHMMPSAELFAARVGELGIANTDHVVAYDAMGVATAACRVWWMFRAFGHGRVSVLDGGLPAWLRRGLPTEEGPPVPPVPRTFSASGPARGVVAVDQVLAALDGGGPPLVDARGAGRFQGVEPEPRPTARAGHVPGSLNLPFLDLLDPREMTFRPSADLAAAFERAGVDPAQPLVAACGSGVTACVLAVGAHLLGHDTVSVYDGSWAEWGDRADLPIVGPEG
ncbi:3-mercaptopyruvate sulfurtransferase [Roseospirillum parvum]|uniref:Sulfurtransferase n=1 Tax=Roseospirillum parvum TaxID=83401 RepID=A0A1G7TRK3_9PROT|nr:3-mercaptopyruvate sulfurtransferase [Roseospirillum parvum]SDG37877.1 thiosulfate/3-mercaptopyruvate sulfurtransferase [Roseospirillum parvum]